MQYVCCVFLTIIGLVSGAHARTESSGTKDIIRSTLMDYFSPYKDISASQVGSVELELLNTQTESKLFYPPFPRTWIERYSSETSETTTTAIFDTSKILTAINTFAGPLSAPVNAILNGAQISYRYEQSIKYSYTKATTLMVMTSWRQLRDPNNPNENVVPKDILENSVIVQKRDLYNYFKVSKDYPLLGMCKYEMALAIQKSKTDTLNIVFGSRANGENVLDGMSYTVYSNFFQIEDHVPVEDYLRVRCGENFTEAVRFLVESEFNKMVTGHFAHYHPRSECRWRPTSASTPKNGDPDCMNWFNKLDIYGLDKNVTSPRCILGEQGYPVCSIKTSREGAHCPLYSSQGKISTKEPARWDRQLNPMDNAGLLNWKALYQCDYGLECRLGNGNSIASIPLSSDPRERRRHLQRANYITTCQKIINRGGR